MIATRSRDRLAFLIAAAVSLVSSPILAIWSLVIGSEHACAGAALMIPSGTRAGFAYPVMTIVSPSAATVDSGTPSSARVAALRPATASPASFSRPS